MDIKKIGISPSLPSFGQNQETKKTSDFQRILQEAQSIRRRFKNQSGSNEHPPHSTPVPGV